MMIDRYKVDVEMDNKYMSFSFSDNLSSSSMLVIANK